jgi:DNA-binding transcriptional regulator YdaS (Cro superfamily)
MVLATVILLQVHPSVVSQLVRGELVVPSQRTSIVELFRPA